MEVPLYNTKGKKIGKVNLNKEIFSVKPKETAIYEVIKRQLAVKRSGTASSKTRAEVHGGGVKPWRQKGTGRARAGSIRSPIWRGGGAVFGPKPRKYDYRIQKKVKSIAIKSALSFRAGEGNIIVLDKLEMKEISSKKAWEIILALKIDYESILAVMHDKNEMVKKSFQNLYNIHLLEPGQLNAYDILLYDKILLTKETLEEIEKRMGILGQGRES